MASGDHKTKDLSHVLRRPRVTEKASMKAESGVYTFEVDVAATKKAIAVAIKKLYNVEPVKVAIVPIPKKNVIVRNKRGVKKGGKKAYVYLKEGDKIEFV
jgi:large subunit ribosomal protein L23